MTPFIGGGAANVLWRTKLGDWQLTMLLCVSSGQDRAPLTTLQTVERLRLSILVTQCADALRFSTS